MSKPHLLGCPVGRYDQWLGSGLFHLLINGVVLGVISPTDPFTIDPNFRLDIQVQDILILKYLLSMSLRIHVTGIFTYIWLIFMVA